MPKACLNCHSASIVETTKDVLILVAGESTKVILAVHGWHCLDCGAVMFFDEDESVRQLNALKYSPAKAIANQAEFIRDTRVHLNLTQQEAEEILGGNEGSFSKYEKIEAIPSRSLLHLLKILAKHPELLQEVRSYG